MMGATIRPGKTQKLRISDPAATGAEAAAVSMRRIREARQV
jgi:hypothetical protein